MKTYNHLFEDISSFENMLAASRLAGRGKRLQDNVGRFSTKQESHILKLSCELKEKTYQPGPYRTKMITRPKVRMISAAPFRDRVVHHALCRVVMPLFERKMVYDLYSNRSGKGTHAAILRAQHYSRRHPYVLKADIQKYFPSMDHLLLKDMFRQTIRCKETLWLMDRILNASNPQDSVCTLFPGDQDLMACANRRVGLPIGNLTSQWFAGIYLAEFDHWVKETLRCPGYVRYVDDFLLYGDDKRILSDWRKAIQHKLHSDFRLRLNERKTRCYRTLDGVSFLGQRVWPDHRRLMRENVVSSRRRLLWNVRQYQEGRLSKEALKQRWHSWCGHAAQADGFGIIQQLERELRHALGTTG